MSDYERIEVEDGNLLDVEGFRGGAVAAKIKPSGKKDVAILRIEGGATAAAVFTKNRMPAAPVVLGRRALSESPKVRSLVINAGNANAMTGARGMGDAQDMARRTAELNGAPALVFSTGVIGVPLPMGRVMSGIEAATESLAAGTEAGAELAEAILTTDTFTKTGRVRIQLDDGREVTIGGMAKGSGMIHPNMATMLGFVGLDLPLRPEAAQEILRYAVDRSFHEITVDGDTSTNDAVLLLARGSGEAIGADDPAFERIRSAVTCLCAHLAREIVRDGEGMTRMMEVLVTGAATRADASAIAGAVATSSLVKTALAGGDPNWGRILAAAANAGIDLQSPKLTIGGIEVFADDGPLEVDAEAVDAAFSGDEVFIELRVGDGSESARRLTTDLTIDYVKINSEYTT